MSTGFDREAYEAVSLTVGARASNPACALTGNTGAAAVGKLETDF